MKDYNYKTIEKITNAIFLALGCDQTDAEIITQHLLLSDIRGIKTHGVLRLKEYYDLCKIQRINTQPNIQLIHETPSTGLLDADKSFGMISGRKAMKLAINKAEKAGTGWVAVRNSNHFGIAGAYAMMALPHDMIGICMTNANPLVAPTNSLNPLLGTNPIALAIPSKTYPPFVADFATAPTSRGKLDILSLDGKEAPENLLQDMDGKPTTEAGILKKGGSIKTLGGDYERGGHKGFCMSAWVDIFSAVLSGANFGPTVVPTLNYLDEQKSAKKNMGIGHFFGAMRIDAFQTKEEFLTQMDNWIEKISQSKPINPTSPIIIPGTPERIEEEHHRKNGTIPLSEQAAKNLFNIAEELL